MTKNYFAGIDVGTSYTKAVIIDDKKEIIGSSTDRSSADLKKSIKSVFKGAISDAKILTDAIEVGKTGEPPKTVEWVNLKEV